MGLIQIHQGGPRAQVGNYPAPGPTLSPSPARPSGSVEAQLANGRIFWNSELAREKMWGRIYLIPLLQAETDRDQVRRYWADQGREQELLGKTTKVYHSDRYARLLTLLSAREQMLTECGAGS